MTKLICSLTVLLTASMLLAPAQAMAEADHQPGGTAQLEPVAAVEADVEADQQADPQTEASSSTGVAPQAPADDTQPAGQAAAADELGQVGWVALRRGLPEAPSPISLFGEKDNRTFRALINQFDHVAKSPSHRGMVIFYDGAPLSLTQVQELRDAIGRIREQGKTVAVFAESFTTGSYLLAAAADRIILQNKGEIMLHGIATEEMYLAGMLKKIGLQADLIQIGEYKGAADPLTRTSPSPEHNQTIDNLLDDLYAQMLEAVAEGRKVQRPQAEKLMRDSWLLRDRKLIRAGLVDNISARDLQDVTEQMFGASFVWDEDMGQADHQIPADNPFALFRMLLQPNRQQVRDPSIAIIHMHGAIHSGDSGEGGMFDEQSIGSRTIARTLADVRDDERIKGVVIRLDSPGGSAHASEVIWQAVRELGEVKPVSVSVGSMAASGGYYIASGAHDIYVSPASILGSIGVVGGKITMGGLYDWVGINVHRRDRGPWARMFNSVEPFTPEQRQTLTTQMKMTYDQFIDRVQIGRGRRIADIDAVARGRLFTGRQAIENGLADRIGGLHNALADMASQCELKPGAYDVVTYPTPMSLGEYLESIVDAQAPVPAIRLSTEQAGLFTLLRRAVGPGHWSTIAASLDGIVQLRREPVLLIHPSTLLIRTDGR